jgi:hypothetical protein
MVRSYVATQSNKIQGPQHHEGITSMRLALLPSLVPIGQRTTAAEPLWVHGLAPVHLSAVPDPTTPRLNLWCPATLVAQTLSRNAWLWPNGPPEARLALRPRQ